MQEPPEEYQVRDELGRDVGSPAAVECRQFESLLADWPEGDSDPFFNRHADRCPSCSTLLSDLQIIVSTSRNLPDDDPPATIWPSLRQQLREEGLIREKGQWLRRWLPAWYRPFPTPAVVGVMAAVFLFASLIAFNPTLEKPSQDSLKTVATEDLGDSRKKSAGRKSSARVTLAQANILPALLEMEENYRAQAASLPQEMTSTPNWCMVELDQAIEECIKIIDEEPDNSLAQDHLMSVYEQKAELLASALQWGSDYGTFPSNRD